MTLEIESDSFLYVYVYTYGMEVRSVIRKLMEPLFRLRFRTDQIEREKFSNICECNFFIELHY